MIERFTEAEQRAIYEKLDKLALMKIGNISPEELAEQITKRRIRWMERHLDEMLAKYEDLRPEETPEDSHVRRVSPSKIRIDSYNFCPYLEACRELGLDTSFVCKQIGEPSVQAACELINHDLAFSRNYDHLRPSCDFCEEYIELIE